MDKYSKSASNAITRNHIYPLSIINYEPSTSIRIFVNVYIDSIGWQNFCNEFWPFDKTECPTIKIIFNAHIIDLFQFMNAVEVKMVDGCRSIDFQLLLTLLFPSASERCFPVGVDFQFPSASERCFFIFTINN